MTKFLLVACTTTFFSFAVKAQVTLTTSPTPTTVLAPTPQQNEFDKKNRFGIRVTPQPSWYKSDNTSSKGNGAFFGFGFGLVWERKLSNIIHFSTGIGGDFEGGIVSYRNDAEFKVKEVINSEGVLVEAKNGIANSDYDLKSGNTLYTLKERKYRSTMITIPLLLKMMTNEYSGFRYFGVFGGELGIRAGLKADDTYSEGYKATPNGATGPAVPVESGDLSRTGILVGKDASLLPFRVGMNLGLGTEYRIAGTTSLLFSVNYFQSFTNLMRNESKFLTKEQNLDLTNNTYNFSALNQSYMMRAIRINIAIMF